MVYLLSLYLFPPLSFLRPEFFIVLGLLSLAFIRANLSVVKMLRLELMCISILIFLVIVTLMFQGTLKNSFIFQDTMIGFRYMYYGAAIVSGGVLACSLKTNTSFKYLLALIGTSAVIMSIFQYYNVLEINSHIVPIYGLKHENLLGGTYWRRIIGTMGNPNYWGLTLSFFFIASCYQIIALRKWAFTIPTVLLFFCIILTGSRTALLASLFALIVGIPVISIRGGDRHSWINWSKSAAIVLLFISVIYGLMSLTSSSLYENEGRFEINNTETLEFRVSHWKQELGRIAENPYQLIVGQGPSKATSIRYGDNAYVRLLRDFGLLSLITYLMMMTIMYRRLRRGIFHLSSSDGIKLPLMFLFLLCLWIFDLAADAWFNVRIMGFVLFAYGYVIISSRLSSEVITENLTPSSVDK